MKTITWFFRSQNPPFAFIGPTLSASPLNTHNVWLGIGWLTLCCSALRAPPLRPLPVRALVLYRRNIGLNARPWKRKGKLIRLSPRPSAGCAGPVILPLGRRLAQEAREYQSVVRVHCSFDSQLRRVCPAACSSPLLEDPPRQFGTAGKTETKRDSQLVKRFDGSGIYLDADPEKVMASTLKFNLSRVVSSDEVIQRSEVVESVLNVHHYESATLLSCRSGC